MRSRIRQVSTVVALMVASGGTIFPNASPASATEIEACVPARSGESQMSITGNIFLNREQDANGRLVVGIAENLGLPPKAAEVTIAAALAQSSMSDPGELEPGVHGILRQRSSRYPGIDLTDQALAIEAFLERMISIEGWEATPNSELAQRLVGSARSDLYEVRGATAAELVAFYTGDPDNPTTCTAISSTDDAETGPEAEAESEGEIGAEGQTESEAGTETESESDVEVVPSEPVETAPYEIYPTEIEGIVELRDIQVHESIAGNINALLLAAEGDGIDLGVNSSWRDPQKQIELRIQNCGPSDYQIYHQRASSCSPPTAKPGTSQHEKGFAIDFSNCAARSTICYVWLDANAARFGLKNLPSEPWHWSTTGG